MKIKIVYGAAGGEITVEKFYETVMVGSEVRPPVLKHVTVSGPFPVATMLKVQRWVYLTEKLKTQEEKDARLPAGLEFATEIWSEIS